MSNGSEHMSEVAKIADLCECGSGTDHASDLEVIRHDIWELKSTVTGLMQMIEPISAEIAPAMDALAASPLGKMLGMGGNNG